MELFTSFYFNFIRLANFEHASQTDVVGSSDSGLAEYVASQVDQTLSWNDVTWLKGITSLPIVLKGILTGQFIGALCDDIFQ